MISIYGVLENLVKQPGDFFENMETLFRSFEKSQFSLKITRFKCPHGKRRTLCKECGGTQLCAHGNRKDYCKECGGSQICVHGKNKRNCKNCGGRNCCEHGKLKQNCQKCKSIKYKINTNNFCLTKKCFNIRCKKWDGYCNECFEKE